MPPLGRPTLTTEERTGDPTHGVHTLFDIDSEREEINAFSRSFVGCGCHEGFGIAH